MQGSKKYQRLNIMKITGESGKISNMDPQARTGRADRTPILFTNNIES